MEKTREGRDSEVEMARVSVGDKVSSLVALAVLVVGLGIAGVGAYDYVGQSTAVENAVTVEATVTETEVTEVSKRRGGTEYDPDVRFRYTYEGERYVSENLFPATVTPDYGTREEAESVLEGYGTEATTEAYVNPESPEEAFLKNETTKTPLTVAVMGLFMGLLGGTSFVKSFKR